MKINEEHQWALEQTKRIVEKTSDAFIEAVKELGKEYTLDMKLSLMLTCLTVFVARQSSTIFKKNLPKEQYENAREYFLETLIKDFKKFE